MLVRLKGINRVTKRLADGRIVTYHYAWKSGPPLQGAYGSPEFVADYLAAVGSQRSGRLSGKEFRSIINRYLRSPEYTRLSKATQRGYSRQLGKIETEFGDLPIAVFADRSIRQDVKEWKARIAERSERDADFAAAVFSRVISWAYDQALVPAHHLDKLGRLYRADRSNKIWSDEHIEAFYAKAPAHLHLALSLALWTGQRKSDVLALKWSDYDGGRIRLRQKKTGAKVGVPVSEKLRQALDARRVQLGINDTALCDKHILTTLDGAPWGSGFSASWRKACAQAGVKGVSFHDLRGTMVTRLARAGCSIPQIASISGHSLRDVHDILEAHYLHLDEAMADSAIRQLEGDSPNQSPNRYLHTPDDDAENT